MDTIFKLIIASLVTGMCEIIMSESEHGGNGLNVVMIYWHVCERARQRR